MINNVVLVGRVVRDPELRYTPQNTAVATFTIAVNRRFKTRKANVKLISLTVSSGANLLKTWQIGLKRCLDWCNR